MATAYVQNIESVTSETFEAETVVINFVSGVYFSLSGSAPLIWRLLKTPTSFDVILASIVDDPSVARDAVQAMLDHLITENCVHIVQIDEKELGRLREPTYEPYSPPIVETFHDLQELIVVDPVHEIDEIDGWPHRPSPLSLE
jgi:hypothetical protein